MTGKKYDITGAEMDVLVRACNKLEVWVDDCGQRVTRAENSALHHYADEIFRVMEKIWLRAEAIYIGDE